MQVEGFLQQKPGKGKASACSISEGGKYHEKISSFLKYKNQSIILEMMGEIDLSTIGFPRRFILWLIMHNMYLPIAILSKIRYSQKHNL